MFEAWIKYPSYILPPPTVSRLLHVFIPRLQFAIHPPSVRSCFHPWNGLYRAIWSRKFDPPAVLCIVEILGIGDREDDRHPDGCQSIKVDNPPRFRGVEIAVHLSPTYPSFLLLTREKEREDHGTSHWFYFRFAAAKIMSGTG